MAKSSDRVRAAWVAGIFIVVAAVISVAWYSGGSIQSGVKVEADNGSTAIGVGGDAGDITINPDVEDELEQLTKNYEIQNQLRNLETWKRSLDKVVDQVNSTANLNTGKLETIEQMVVDASDFTSQKARAAIVAISNSADRFISDYEVILDAHDAGLPSLAGYNYREEVLPYRQELNDLVEVTDPQKKHVIQALSKVTSIIHLATMAFEIAVTDEFELRYNKIVEGSEFGLPRS